MPAEQGQCIILRVALPSAASKLANTFTAALLPGESQEHIQTPKP